MPQKLNNFGPATLSINLNYYGRNTTRFDVAVVVKPQYDDRNVSPQELVDYTNNHTDLRAALYRSGDLDLAKQLIAAAQADYARALELRPGFPAAEEALANLENG